MRWGALVQWYTRLTDCVHWRRERGLVGGGGGWSAKGGKSNHSDTNSSSLPSVGAMTGTTHRVGPACR